jgi:hypothetical protein
VRTLVLLSTVACFLAAPSAIRAQGEFPLKYQQAPYGDPLLVQSAKSALVYAQRPANLKGVPRGLPEKASWFALPIGGRNVLGVIDPSGPKLYLDTAGASDLSGANPLEPVQGSQGPQQMFGPLAITLPGAKEPTAGGV